MRLAPLLARHPKGPGGCHRPEARRNRRPEGGRSPARLFALALIGLAVGVLALPGRAAAHDYGPFAIDRYIGVLVSPDGITVDYVVDLGEAPTQWDGEEIEADPAAWCAGRLDGFAVDVDGAAVALRPGTATVFVRPGNGGLDTMRIECGWTGDLGSTDTSQRMVITDVNDEDELGWREIVVVGDRVAITGDVSAETDTARLTDVPQNEDENPRTRAVTFDFVASGEVGPGQLDDTEFGGDSDTDILGDLITDAESGWGMLAALAIAAFLGALHSLAPGHGKTVIGAYLIGTRGTKIQAFVLAIAVALSHTLGVLLLGIITYIAGATFAPENVYPWLQALSAAIVFGIGIWLVWMAWREYHERRAALAVATHGHGGGHGHSHDRGHDHGHSHGHSHGHHDHGSDHGNGHHHHDGHDHDHGHDHGHSHDHEHEHSHEHSHAHEHEHEHSHENDHEHVHATATESTTAALSMSGAATVGASSASTHDHGHSHVHDHAHDHDHGHGHDHAHDHSHDHSNGAGWHRHGIFPHTHRYDLDEMDLQGKVSWKTLALLGLTGGLVPSTSAIIVLLGAIQLNRVAFGGLLILSFGIGMSVALVSVGLGMVALRDRVFGTMDGNDAIRAARVAIVPLAAMAVLAVGTFLVVRAFITLA